jgi:hypothetical protein
MSHNEEEFNFFGVPNRKESVQSNWSNFNVEPGLRRDEPRYHNQREETFFEKVLPGLNCMAFLGMAKEGSNYIDNELESIDPSILNQNSKEDTSPQQFFNLIENESDYELMKNKKIGMSTF